MKTKICKICWEEKDINAFEKWRCQCRECRNAYKRKYSKKYYLDNKEMLKEKVNLYRINNIDKIKESRHKHYILNKDRIDKKNREYMKEHPEKRRLYFNNRYYKNREEILKRGKESCRQWHKNNRYKANVVWRTSRYILKHWIQLPQKCSICWAEWCEIERHHPDYNKRYEVVMLCNSCHWKANRKIEWFTSEVLNPYIINILNPI